MKKVTAEQYKTFAGSRETQYLAKLVLGAQAAAEVMKDRVANYTMPIFQRFKFNTVDERITHPDLLYMCPDRVMLDHYYDELQRAHVDNGNPPEKPECCPYLEHRSRAIDAENLLLEHFENFLGVEKGTIQRAVISVRDKALEIILAVAVNHPNSTIQNEVDTKTLDFSANRPEPEECITLK